MDEHTEVSVPRDFAARYGAGLDRGLSLGGGGIFFIAWMASYLHAISQRGLDLTTADRVVGTSAGSMVGTALMAGHLRRVDTELSWMAKLPKSVTARAMAAVPSPSQNRALELMLGAADAEPATVSALGHAALAAVPPSSKLMQRSVGFMVGAHRWPSPSLEITCVDAFTAERCVVSSTSGVSLLDAISASCAVPGFAPPHPIGDRRCMDGGMAGTGVHLDRVAGARRVLVLSLSGAEGISDGFATQASGSAARELADLADAGTEVLHRSPEAVTFEELMTPDSVPEALAMGRRQGAEDLELIREFWR